MTGVVEQADIGRRRFFEKDLRGMFHVGEGGVFQAVDLETQAHERRFHEPGVIDWVGQRPVCISGIADDEGDARFRQNVGREGGRDGRGEEQPTQGLHRRISATDSTIRSPFSRSMALARSPSGRRNW